MNAELPLLHWTMLAAGLVAAAAWDLRVRRIPNWLTVSVLLVGLVARLLVHGWSGAGWGLAGAVLGLLLLLWPFARGWLGAGDVKLLAAVGAWLGPLHAFYAAIAAAIAGGILSLIYIARAPRDVRADVRSNLTALAYSGTIPEATARPAAQSPPYAVAIAVGAIAVVALRLGGLLGGVLGE